MAMNYYHLEDLSVYYYLKALLPASVTVVDAHNLERQIITPSVSLDDLSTNEYQIEQGSSSGRLRRWRIDIYAKDKVQRGDIAFRIFEHMEANKIITVYDYNVGFPPIVAPPIGRLQIIMKSIEPMPIMMDMERRVQYWHSLVNFTTLSE